MPSATGVMEKRDRLLDKQLAEAEAREGFERRRQAEGVKVGYSGKTTGRVENDSPRPISDVTCKIMSKTGRRSVAVPVSSGELGRTLVGRMFVPDAKPLTGLRRSGAARVRSGQGRCRTGTGRHP
jgi:hypothetical protein